MSLSKLYSVYCEGRWLQNTADGLAEGEHAVGCPVYSPNMSTSKEARAEAKRQGWFRGKMQVLSQERMVDLSPQCANRGGLS